MSEKLEKALQGVRETVELCGCEDDSCPVAVYSAFLRIEIAIRGLADEQGRTDALLREMIKARPDLAREKADAVPTPAQAAARLGRELVERYGGAAPEGPMPKVTPRRPYYDDKPDGLVESDRDYMENNSEAAIWALDNAAHVASALRRAEAAEKERDALKANGHRAEREQSGLRARIKVLENHGWRLEAERDCARDSRDAREADCSLLKQERDALRADCEDCEGLSKLHDQDKAELARWRKAAGELRNLFGTDKPMGSPHYYAEDFVRVHLRAVLKDAEKP